MMLFEKISARVGFFFGCNQEEAIVRISPEMVSIYIDASFFYAFLVNFYPHISFIEIRNRQSSEFHEK